LEWNWGTSVQGSRLAFPEAPDDQAVVEHDGDQHIWHYMRPFVLWKYCWQNVTRSIVSPLILLTN
jgi:hypothetical protein